MSSNLHWLKVQSALLFAFPFHSKDPWSKQKIESGFITKVPVPVDENSKSEHPYEHLQNFTTIAIYGHGGEILEVTKLCEENVILIKNQVEKKVKKIEFWSAASIERVGREESCATIDNSSSWSGSGSWDKFVCLFLSSLISSQEWRESIDKPGCSFFGEESWDCDAIYQSISSSWRERYLGSLRKSTSARGQTWRWQSKM